MYQWLVFVHLAGVFGFLATHGVSMGVSFRLRTERDPRRVNDLLQMSGWSVRAFYASLAVLLAGGIAAGFVGHWWGRAWIWAAIAILVVTSGAMYGMARPYFRRIGLVARARAEGTTAVTEEQFERMLRAPNSMWVIAVGSVGLLAILYLMIFKPTFGIASSTGAVPVTPTSSSTSSTSSTAGARAGSAVGIAAQGLSFSTSTLSAPAGTAFTIRFDNAAPGIPHNVAIYTNRSATVAVFRGAVVSGPKVVVYRVGALSPGTYFFRCDVHPTLMTGTLVVR